MRIRFRTQRFHNDVQCIENAEHLSGKVDFMLHICNRKKQQQCYGVCLYDVAKLKSSSLHPFWRVQAECMIEQQQPRYQNDQG